MYGRFSGVYRDPKPYDFKLKGGPTMSAEDERKANAKDRYCLNWACRKIYK